MIANIPHPPLALSGLRKAAMLLIIVGETIGAELIRQFSEEEVQVISHEIARVSQITSEEADAVLEEFHQMMVARDFVVKGGIDYARKMLLSAFGPEASNKLVDRVIKALGHDVASFDAPP